VSQIKIVSFKLFIFFVFLFCYSGCSDKNKQPTVSTIIHPENWINGHSTGYLAFKEKTGCTNCHGISCAGGNAKVSCFSTNFEGQACHEPHPDGWKNFTSHGKVAKYDSTKGLPACQKCHGQDFTGGIVNVSCFTCHGVSAPHPRAPWNNKSSDDTTGTDTTTPRAIHHAKTSPMPLSNLTVCFGCHENGKYSRKKPDPAIAKGAGLECGNNTICHSKKW
jgi:cytochrome c553